MNLMQFFNIWLAYVAKRKSQSGKSMKCSKRYVFLSITLSQLWRYMWVAQFKTVRQINIQSETTSRFCIIFDAHIYIYLPWKLHWKDKFICFLVFSTSLVYMGDVSLPCTKKGVTRLPIYLMIPEKSGIFPAQTSMDILNKKKEIDIDFPNNEWRLAFQQFCYTYCAKQHFSILW